MPKTQKTYVNNLNIILIYCRSDEWEIDRKSLLISDQKLGKGAFGDVFKGTIIGPAPILFIYPDLALELDDNRVAIKMLPAHVMRMRRRIFCTKWTL